MVMDETKLSLKSLAIDLKTLTVQNMKQLAIYLGVKYHRIVDIENDNRGSSSSCKHSIIQAWLDTDTEASWEKIVSGLKQIEMNVLAREVANRHCPKLLITSASNDTHQENIDHTPSLITMKPDTVLQQGGRMGVPLANVVVISVVIGLLSVLLGPEIFSYVQSLIWQTLNEKVGGNFSDIAPLYRYWRLEVSDHFYTTNPNEIGTIVYGESGRYGYKFEGVQCYIYNSHIHDTVPLYRYWKNSVSDHFYTTAKNEIGTTISGTVGRHDYKCEGIAGYCFPAYREGNIPLYRYWNPSSSDHFYTTNSGEIGTVTPQKIGNHGYISEGIVCYVPPA